MSSEKKELGKEGGQIEDGEIEPQEAHFGNTEGGDEKQVRKSHKNRASEVFKEAVAGKRKAYQLVSTPKPDVNQTSSVK